jgi:pseudaminic acid synthase
MKSVPFIIAEMSGNHNHSLDRALAIVDAAADAGAHAIKLQTYTADTMTLPGVHRISDHDSLWKGKELYDLYKEAYTPWEWHKPIFDHAKKRGILAFSSPFDASAVDFLETLDVPAYKIASFENTDWPLLKKVAQTGKPVIISTGASTLADIDDSVRVLRENGCTDITLLKCTSSYPSTPETANLATIPHMIEMFNCKVGLSDHTMGIGVAVAAVALGATVIEKHLTIRRADGGVDSAFSMEPHELAALVIESERAYQAKGTVHYGVLETELKSIKHKRSIYVRKDIQAGEPITAENVQVIRPADGLLPRYYDDVLGRKANQDLKSGTPLDWKHLS